MKKYKSSALTNNRAEVLREAKANGVIIQQLETNGVVREEFVLTKRVEPTEQQPNIAMKMPDFLIEMSEQMNKENARCTADPVWQVRCKRTRITSEDMTDRYQLICSEERYSVADSEINEEFNEQIVNHLDCDPNDLPIILEEWVDSEVEGDLDGQEKIDYFIENFDCETSDLEGFRLIWVEEYEDVVMGAFLTEQDANWFINRKQHDYPKLYTYVTSMYFSVQMKELRAWIKSLTEAGEQ